MHCQDRSCSDETMIYCDQCEREYHVGCLRAQGRRLKNIPTGDWFCSKECSAIKSDFAKFVGRWHKIDKNVHWSIFHSSVPPHAKYLKAALAIFEECFDPIVNQRTWENQAEMMVKSSASIENNFKGFHTFVLRVGKLCVSAATIRIFGEHVAEMPLVATKFSHRNRGLCKLLMNSLENVLKKLVCLTLACKCKQYCYTNSALNYANSCEIAMQRV